MDKETKYELKEIKESYKIKDIIDKRVNQIRKMLNLTMLSRDDIILESLNAKYNKLKQRDRRANDKR